MQPLRVLGVGLFLFAVAVLTLSSGERARSQPPDPVAEALAHLRADAQRHGIADGLADLRVVRAARSLGADHVLFQQTRGGIPVAGAYITVALPDRAGLDPLVLGSPVETSRISVETARISSTQAIALALRSLDGNATSLRGEDSASLAYVASGRDHRLAWQVVLPLSDPLGTWLVEVAADSGEILSQTDLLRSDSGQAFDPNPAKTSGGSIPPPTDCDSSANESLLSGEYQTRTLLGIASGQNKLRGSYVDLTAPGIVGGYKPAGVAQEASRSYVYACKDDRFEEVMAYYHVDTTQRKIQALGFSGASAILDHPIPAHAHYFSDCNAFYDPASRGIHFGDSVGCSPATDTAEDADVIVHEYGHAIQDDQIPGFGFGDPAEVEEAWAMGEGFSDFLAAAIFGDPCVGEWVNFGGSACGGQPGLRTVDNDPAVYHNPEWLDACRPTPSDPAEPHCAGLIWGGALWDLVKALGNDQAARDLVLTLVLDSHFYMDPASDFAEAAAAIRQADTVVYGGSHVATIDSVFSARGISDIGPISDFPYAYLRIRHTFRGDLDVQLKVGSTSTPLCEINVWDPSGDSSDDLVGYVELTTSCNAFLPPTPAQPWYLEVRDVFSQDVGTIEEFEIVLSGTERCVATDVPIAVPDNDDFVYSMVDCTTVVRSLTDSDTDTFADIVDNCPAIANPGQENLDGDDMGDACDEDDDGDLVADTDEAACGGDPVDPALAPERLGNAIDDDGDTNVDNAHAAVPGSDCDGDGYKDDMEAGLTWPPDDGGHPSGDESAGAGQCNDISDDDGDGIVNDGCPGAVGHQSRCADTTGGANGNNEDDDQWPADFNDDGKLNLVDVNSFVVPVRHFLQSPLTDHARWDLKPGGTTVDLADVNNLNTLAPPMLDFARAFAAACSAD